MDDPLFFGLIFLMAVAVVAAYFYLKRAQRRPTSATTAQSHAHEAGEVHAHEEPPAQYP